MTDISKMSDKQLAELSRQISAEQYQRKQLAREKKAGYWRENYEGKYILVGEDLYFIRNVEDEYRCDAVCLLHNSDTFEKNPGISFKYGTIYGFFNDSVTKIEKIGGKSLISRGKVVSKEKAAEILHAAYQEMLAKFDIGS